MFKARPISSGIRRGSGRGNAPLRQLDDKLAPWAIRTLGVLRHKRPLGLQPRRIGLMKTAGIGDMVLLTAVARDVMATLPDSELMIIGGPENAELAELLPDVKVVGLPPAQPWKVVPLLRSLRLDALVDFGQWTRIEAIYTALSGARWAAGFETPGQRRHFAYDATVLHRDNVPEIENYRALTARLGVHSTSDPCFEADAGTPLPADVPYVVLHLWPGGFRSELREWPVERWRAIVSSLLQETRAVVLTGGIGDVARTNAFIDSCGENSSRMISVAGRYRLTELVSVLASARCVVSVNTSVMHLAAAAGAPTIALNGPTSSLRWGATGPNVTNLDSEFPGCGFLNLGFEYEGRRRDCMSGIVVERVLGAVREHAHV